MCVTLLAKINADPVVPALIEALSDVNVYVRYEAVYALADVGDARALPILDWMREHDTDLLHDGEESIAESADYAVGCIRKRLSS